MGEEHLSLAYSQHDDKWLGASWSTRERSIVKLQWQTVPPGGLSKAELVLQLLARRLQLQFLVVAVMQ